VSERHAQPPPQALDSAEYVLGALLLAGEYGGEQTLRRVRETGLARDDFYFRERHGAVYAAVVELADRGAATDVAAVAAELERSGRLEAVGGRLVLAELAALVPATSNAPYHARLVLEAAQARAGWRSASSDAPLDALVEFVRRFVVLSSSQALAVALWTAHTYVYAAFDCSPYLAVTSAEKRSGKSRLLDVLELVVARPWPIVNPSEAVVYRKIARDAPTLLLDEVDAIFSRNADTEPLRALLNAGNRRGVRVPRCAGAQRDRLEEFEVYCPKALAGIGRLPDTVADRSVAVALKRRAPGERIDRFRRRDVEPEAVELRECVQAWAEACDEYLAYARPDLPEQLDDRALDAWEPLLALADLAGGEWPQRARQAALELSGDGARGDESLGVRLLADLRRVFDDRDVDRLATADLLDALRADDEAPWQSYGRGDKPLAPSGLARLLRPFEVRPRTVRLDDGTTPKGYLRASLEDAWTRYLPPDRVPKRHNATTGMVEPETGDFEPPQAEPCGGSKTAANPHEQSDVTLWRLGVQESGCDADEAVEQDADEPVEQDGDDLDDELERLRALLPVDDGPEVDQHDAGEAPAESEEP
jgi:hypothetical protein